MLYLTPRRYHFKWARLDYQPLFRKEAHVNKADLRDQWKSSLKDTLKAKNSGVLARTSCETRILHLYPKWDKKHPRPFHVGSPPPGIIHVPPCVELWCQQYRVLNLWKSNTAGYDESMWQVTIADPVYIKELLHKHVFHIALHLCTYITDHFVLLFLHVHIKQWQVANGFWSVVEDFIQPDGWTYPLMIKITLMKSYSPMTHSMPLHLCASAALQLYNSTMIHI